MKPKHLMTLYAVALLVYAGWRSFDYMTRLLTDVPATVANLVAAVFLFASEIGLLVWLYVAGPNATTEAQESTATVLVGVNFVGSMILGLADILAHNSLYAFEVTWIAPLLLLTPWVLVAANVAGHIVYHRADADEALARAERALQFQERRLHIAAKTTAIASLRDEQEALAAELAPVYFRDIRERVTGVTMRRVARKAQALPQDGQPTAAPARTAARRVPRYVMPRKGSSLAPVMTEDDAPPARAAVTGGNGTGKAKNG